MISAGGCVYAQLAAIHPATRSPRRMLLHIMGHEDDRRPERCCDRRRSSCARVR